MVSFIAEELTALTRMARAARMPIALVEARERRLRSHLDEMSPAIPVQYTMEGGNELVNDED